MVHLDLCGPGCGKMLKLYSRDSIVTVLCQCWRILRTMIQVGLLLLE